MENILIIILVTAIVGGAGLYIRNAKKRGTKCIGCPHGRSCNGNCGDCAVSQITE